MMLARVAEALFWAARDLERAETTVRALEVGHAATLEETAGNGSGPLGEASWETLLDLAGDAGRFARLEERADEQSALSYLAFSEDNRDSVLASITRARETARSVRDRLPSEVWEAINTLYLDLASWTPARLQREGPYTFCSEMRRQIFLVNGLMEHSVRRDDVYQFMRLGRYLERLERTASLLEVAQGIDRGRDVARLLDGQRSAMVLRTARAFEAFIAEEPNDISPAAVSRFLILDERHPCAIAFCVDNLRDALDDLEGTRTLAPGAPPLAAVAVARDLLQAAGVLPWDRILADLLERLRWLRETIEMTIIESCFLAQYERRPESVVALQAARHPQG